MTARADGGPATPEGRWLSPIPPGCLHAAEELPALPVPVDDAKVPEVAAPAPESGVLAPIPPALAVLDVYGQLGLRPRGDEPRLRAEVVDRLLQAQAGLPDGFSLTLLDCWRTRELQRALMSFYAGELETDASALLGYVSDPDDVAVVPPHTTGGAVDLTLALDGVALALGTDFDAFDESAHLLHHEAADGDPQVRACRRLLGKALGDAGFAPYPREWWHWSYGDQRWAAQTGRDTALFGLALS